MAIGKWCKFSLLIALVWSGIANQAQARGAVLSAGAAYAPQLSSDGHSYDIATPFSLRGGYWFTIQKVNLETYLEYQQYQIVDGADLLSISRIHRELSIWARYRIIEKWRTTPYVALGMGASSDKIKTRFNGESAIDSQSPEFMLGGTGGVAIAIFDGIEASLEGRISTASTFQPNPLLQLGAYLGYRF